MKLENLTKLHRSMITNEYDYQVFEFTYNKIDFSALLINAITDFKTPNSPKSYTLSIFKKGTTDSRTFDLIKNNDNLFIHTYLKDRYIDLKNFLEVKYHPTKKFKPTNFFSFVDSRSPTLANMKYLDRKICAKHYPTTEDNEQDKIYFLSFKDNDKGKIRKDGKKPQRSLENYSKTEALIPEANKIIGNRNISVCFTPKDRYRLNESKNMIDDFKKI